MLLLPPGGFSRLDALEEGFEPDSDIESWLDERDPWEFPWKLAFLMWELMWGYLILMLSTTSSKFLASMAST